MSSPCQRDIDCAKLTRWYNAQARFYSLRRDDFSDPHVQHVAARLDATRDLQILDAGCGTGLMTIGLARHCKRWNLCGFDASSGMLEVGQEHARKQQLSNVSFKQGDVLQLPFDDAVFDVVIAAGLFPNLNDPSPALEQFHRVLRPGGDLLVIEVDPDGMSVWSRLNFRIMILGYRMISSVLPRFKFARGWSLERTTLRAEPIAQMLAAAGFVHDAPVAVGQHWVLGGQKQSPRRPVEQ